MRYVDRTHQGDSPSYFSIENAHAFVGSSRDRSRRCRVRRYLRDLRGCLRWQPVSLTNDSQLSVTFARTRAELFQAQAQPRRENVNEKNKRVDASVPALAFYFESLSALVPIDRTELGEVRSPTLPAGEVWTGKPAAEPQYDNCAHWTSSTASEGAAWQTTALPQNGPTREAHLAPSLCLSIASNNSSGGWFATRSAQFVRLFCIHYRGNVYAW